MDLRSGPPHPRPTLALPTEAAAPYLGSCSCSYTTSASTDCTTRMRKPKKGLSWKEERAVETGPNKFVPLSLLAAVWLSPASAKHWHRNAPSL
jgi:hypothetical protein